MRRYAISLFLVGLSLLSFGLWLMLPPSAQAQDETTPEPSEATAEPSSSAIQPTGDNSNCIMCHNAGTPAMYVLADGNNIPVNVDAMQVHNSVHTELGCVDCHGQKAYPHQRQIAANAREYSINMAVLCTNCHEDQVEHLGVDVHYNALVGGNLRAATCTDCHGSHEVQDTGNHIQIVETCEECHQIAASQYRDSVHGTALLNGDENVPTCMSCHADESGHAIEHPTTAAFRNASPEMCATCHADPDLMSQYDITTNVFNSYLNDFHGTTVALFQQTDPNVASNKAVCYDCHGVHNILAPNDENSQVIQNNLLATCRQCHPDASNDFPSSWLGHYEPTFENHPLLTMVNLFYAILIPLVIGAFIFLVGTDIFRMIRQRLSRH